MKSAPRIAVITAFFINGALMTSYLSRLPAIQEKLSLSEGTLGLVLSGGAAGVLTALSIAGGLIARFGSYQVTIGGTLAMFAIIPFFAVAPTPILLWFVLFLYGAAMSVMDVSMNAQAVVVEHVEDRPLMSSFHGWFSVGSLFGALLGSGMAYFHKGPLPHLLMAVSLMGLLALLTYRHLPTEAEAIRQPTGSIFRLPPTALWALGTVGFCSSVGEGSMAEWSAVFLENVLHTSESFAALGLAAFNVTMIVGRMSGDWLASNFDEERIVRWGGLISACGLILAASTTNPLFALIGFALVGIGLANVIPLTFSAAGNYPGIPPGVGIAGVASISYAGLLAGPPIIGLIAEATSLRMSFGFVALLSVALVFASRSVRIAG